jgi:hypothetical protein
MSTQFTLKFLKEKIGAEYVERNPISGKPRIILGLNEVWNAIEEYGGVPKVARWLGLPAPIIWGWIDEHYVPDPFARKLTCRGSKVSDMQLSSVGYEDPETGVCWPWTWALTAEECDAGSYGGCLSVTSARGLTSTGT